MNTSSRSISKSALHVGERRYDVVDLASRCATVQTPAPAPAHTLHAAAVPDLDATSGGSNPSTPTPTPQTTRPEAETADRRRWRAWHDRALWDDLLSRHLDGLAARARVGDTVRAMEIGAAPGRHLSRLHRQFGLDVWGVDYAPAGVALVREHLTAMGLPESQAIEADVFDHAALSRAIESVLGRVDAFDLVVSMGFVEHFDKPEEAIATHARFVRPGGLVIITVPAYRGVNFALLQLMDPALVPLHNLDIMTPTALATATAAGGLEPLEATAYGTINLAGFTTRGRGRRWLLRGLRALQWPLDVALTMGFGGRLPEVHGLSPYVAVVARRPG